MHNPREVKATGRTAMIRTVFFPGKVDLQAFKITKTVVRIREYFVNEQLIGHPIIADDDFFCYRIQIVIRRHNDHPRIRERTMSRSADCRTVD